MQIREATAADWPGIWALMEPIIRAGDTYTLDHDSPEEILRAKWLHAGNTGTKGDGGGAVHPSITFVLENDADAASPTIVATAEMHPNYGGAAAHVANAGFMVHPDHAGKGYARALGRHVLGAARRAGYSAMVFNAVVEANTAAVGLWQSLGFEILATIPEAFDHPRAGRVGLHIMHRSLLDLDMDS